MLCIDDLTKTAAGSGGETRRSRRAARRRDGARAGIGFSVRGSAACASHESAAPLDIVLAGEAGVDRARDRVEIAGRLVGTRSLDRLLGRGDGQWRVGCDARRVVGRPRVDLPAGTMRFTSPSHRPRAHRTAARIEDLLANAGRPARPAADAGVAGIPGPVRGRARAKRNRPPRPQVQSSAIASPPPTPVAGSAPMLGCSGPATALPAFRRTSYAATRPGVARSASNSEMSAPEARPRPSPAARRRGPRDALELFEESPDRSPHCQADGVCVAAVLNTIHRRHRRRDFSSSAQSASERDARHRRRTIGLHLRPPFRRCRRRASAPNLGRVVPSSASTWSVARRAPAWPDQRTA